jgi:hypothetical protein
VENFPNFKQGFFFLGQQLHTLPGQSSKKDLCLGTIARDFEEDKND